MDLARASSCSRTAPTAYPQPTGYGRRHPRAGNSRSWKAAREIVGRGRPLFGLEQLRLDVLDDRVAPPLQRLLFVVARLGNRFVELAGFLAEAEVVVEVERVDDHRRVGLAVGPDVVELLEERRAHGGTRELFERRLRAAVERDDDVRDAARVRFAVLADQPPRALHGIPREVARFERR